MHEKMNKCNNVIYFQEWGGNITSLWEQFIGYVPFLAQSYDLNTWSECQAKDDGTAPDKRGY